MLKEMIFLLKIFMLFSHTNVYQHGMPVLLSNITIVMK